MTAAVTKLVHTSETGLACSAAYRAALRQAGSGPLVLTHAAAAGLLLADCGGLSGMAHDMAASFVEDGSWWSGVVDVLAVVRREERGER